MATGYGLMLLVPSFQLPIRCLEAVLMRLQRRMWNTQDQRVDNENWLPQPLKNAVPVRHIFLHRVPTTPSRT